MSEYCRQWAADPSSPFLTEPPEPTPSSSSSSSMTRLKEPSPQGETPSPAAAAAAADSDTLSDDDISLNSSDLDDEGWLDVATAQDSASPTASALGSSFISDLPLSSREPSERDHSDSSSDIYEDEVAQWISSAAMSREGTDSNDDIDETPLASASASTFQRSWIFPDPNSPSNSFSTATGASNTPRDSLANLHTAKRREVPGFWNTIDTKKVDQETKFDPVTETEPETSDTKDEDSSCFQGVEHAKDSAVGPPEPTSAAEFTTRWPKLFLTFPTGALRKRWYASARLTSADARSVVGVAFALIVLVARMGPASHVVGFVSQTFAPSHSISSTPAARPPVEPPKPPAPPRTDWALGAADLQIVRNALAVLSTDTAPKDEPTKAPPPSEYSFVWHRLRKRKDETTDQTTDVAVMTTKSLSVVPPRSRRCSCPPSACKCPPDSFTGTAYTALVAADDYARWTLSSLCAIAAEALRVVADEVAFEVAFLRRLADDFVGSDSVRAIVDAAVLGNYERVYARVRDAVCANDRCTRAAANAKELSDEARARGWSSIRQARRGLDIALARGASAIDMAVAKSREVLDVAAAGARAGSCRQDKSVKEHKRGGCGGRYQSRAKRAALSTSGNKSGRGWSRRLRRARECERVRGTNPLQCGFRGSAGCRVHVGSTRGAEGND